jgi:hypothetical protein
MPLLTIDGQEVTWDQLGRMLMTFEGWQFRMEIVDRSGEGLGSGPAQQSGKT